MSEEIKEVVETNTVETNNLVKKLLANKKNVIIAAAVAIVAVVAIVMSRTPAEVADVNPQGEWLYIQDETEIKAVDYGDLVMYENMIEATCTINEGGDVTLILHGMNLSGTWSVEGNLVNLDFPFEDITLELEYHEDGTMTKVNATNEGIWIQQ